MQNDEAFVSAAGLLLLTVLHIDLKKKNYISFCICPRKGSVHNFPGLTEKIYAIIVM